MKQAKLSTSSSSSSSFATTYPLFHRQIEIATAEILSSTTTRTATPAAATSRTRGSTTAAATANIFAAGFGDTDNPITVDDDDFDSSSSSDDDDDDFERVPLSVLQARLRVETNTQQQNTTNNKRKPLATVTPSASASKKRVKKASASLSIPRAAAAARRQQQQDKPRSLAISSFQTQLTFAPRQAIPKSNLPPPPPNKNLVILRPPPTPEEEEEEEAENQTRNTSDATTTTTTTTSSERAPSESTSPTAEQPTKITSRPRRLYSDSAMDYIPDTTTTATNKGRQSSRNNNILSHLMQRTTRVPTKARRLVATRTPNIPWTVPKWMELHNPHGCNTGNITHICWDAMGVLLTVARSNQLVQIYDWDMVRAADSQGKNSFAAAKHEQKSNDKHKQKQQKKSIGLFQVPPILEFQVPHAISCLQWNSQQDKQDQLAVGFRHAGGKTHIYNVEAVSKWTMKRTSQRFPPANTFQRLQYPRSTGSVESIVFLPNNVVVVSAEHMIYCYHDKYNGHGKQADNTKLTLYWRYQAGAAVTSLVSANKDSSLLVLGTKKGQIGILDWTKRTRERAFSMEYRPVVVLMERSSSTSLIPTKALQQQQRDTNYWKIVHLQVDVDSSETHSNNSNKATATTTAFGATAKQSTPLVASFGIRWVTASGWVLATAVTTSNATSTTSSTTISMATNGCQVIYEPPKVQYRNVNGSAIVVDKPAWSHATFPITAGMVASSSGNKAMLWSPQIPPQVKTLAPHDKYVLADAGSSNSSSNANSSSNDNNNNNNHNTRQKSSSNNKNAWYLQHFGVDPPDATSTSIPLTLNLKERPQVMAIHKSSQEEGMEWMVAGIGKRLVILVARK